MEQIFQCRYIQISTNLRHHGHMEQHAERSSEPSKASGYNICNLLLGLSACASAASPFPIIIGLLFQA